MTRRLLIALLPSAGVPVPGAAQRPVAGHPKVQQALALPRVWLDAQGRTTGSYVFTLGPDGKATRYTVHGNHYARVR